MTSSVQQVFVTFVILMVVVTQFLFMMLSHVNGQTNNIHKTSHFSDSNCTNVYSTSYSSRTKTPCTYTTPATTCDSIAYGKLTEYSQSECATEFPAPASGFLTTYYYDNSSLQCTGPMSLVTVKRMNVCLFEKPSDYVIYDSLGNKIVYNDDKCTSKRTTTTMYLGQCLFGAIKATTLGNLPPQPLIYVKTSYYNASMNGGATCSSRVSSELYSFTSGCPSPAECKQVTGKIAGGESFYETNNCVTVLPTTAAYSSMNVYRHADQYNCQADTGVTRLEVYPINSCSPFIMSYNYDFQNVYIKTDDCKFIRKYNDSSCLNEISQVDLSARNGICDSTGVKYLCNSNNNTGGGGGSGNGGGVTPGNSTRVVINSGSTIHQLSLILSIVFTLLSTITLAKVSSP